MPMVGTIIFSNFLSLISMLFKIQKRAQYIIIIINPIKEQIIPYTKKLLIFFAIIFILEDPISLKC